LGHEASAAEDSFAPRPVPTTSKDARGKTIKGQIERRLLDCPHYTRPQVWKGRAVPEVLLSGDHQAVEQWRTQQMVQRTQERRPDLWKV
jgi:tRNA (guanine37-N1)-methyltransferase